MLAAILVASEKMVIGERRWRRMDRVVKAAKRFHHESQCASPTAAETSTRFHSNLEEDRKTSTFSEISFTPAILHLCYLPKCKQNFVENIPKNVLITC